MTPPIQITEFMALAERNKIGLIDQLAARILQLGDEFALVEAEYYRQKLTDKKSPEFADLAAKHYRMTIEWDALKHAVSALQSTLRAEREWSPIQPVQPDESEGEN